MEKIKIRLPIIVEGKYDKNTLLQIFDGNVISVGGFSIFNSKEKQALLKKLGRDGIILLTDSDGGGRQIRSFLLGILPADKVYNAYIPMVAGKERRKKSPSKQGLLGVEGMDRETLVRVLSPFVDVGERVDKNGSETAKMITKVDFYVDKLTGAENSKERRAKLCAYFDLPTDMTANALISALNLISSFEEYRAAVESLFGDN